MKDTPETILARRIAERSTELHRAYDRFKVQQQSAIRIQEHACNMIAVANVGLALCEKRAAEQGYPSLFTL